MVTERAVLARTEGVQFNPEATYDAALSHLESLFKGVKYYENAIYCCGRSRISAPTGVRPPTRRPYGGYNAAL